MANNVTALAKREEPTSMARGLQIDTMSDLTSFGEMLAKSGYFKDARDAMQACVKVQAGLELGIPPVQAMTGIHIVEGKPTISAALIATLVKRSGKYNYRITAHDETKCVIDFYEGKDKIGSSSFTIADAEKAGVTRNPTWTKYRRNMLFARAMSNGARWHTPDIFGGAIYTPEEMGAEVDGEGEPVRVIDHEPVRSEPARTVTPAKGTDPLAAVKKASWSELDRLKVGDGMNTAEMKQARLNCAKRLNDGVPPENLEQWNKVLDLLKEEPTPTVDDRDDLAENEPDPAQHGED